MNNSSKIQSISQFKEIDIPEGLLSYLTKKAKRQGYVAENKSRYTVTDIIACQRKSYYKSLGVQEEELIDGVTVEHMWDSVRGDLLHQLTYAYKWRELDIEYNISLRDDRTAKLAGRLDMYDWKNATIIDLKTTKYVRWQMKQGYIPKLEHILQLQCYGTIFSELIPIHGLIVIYVDMSDIVAYRVPKKDLTHWITTRIQELEDALMDKKVPAGYVSALCKYCKYQTKCYDDGNGINTKPMSVPKLCSN
jgi:CRISPR/Cas system-associated exonuclease Cas4 (RecB family)